MRQTAALGRSPLPALLGPLAVHRRGHPVSADAADPGGAALELADGSASLIFVTAALGIIPTAALMGRATEELAARSGPGIGGLLNVTFGNFPELVIAFFALLEGLQEVVKASIIGSILGNILLVMGAAMLVGGLGRDRQYFDRTAAGAQSAMLLLAMTALVMPAVFQLVAGGGLPSGDGAMSTSARRRAPQLRRRDRPDRDLRRGPGLLAEDPPRPLQPLARGGGGTRGLERAPRRDRARDRGRAGRRDERGAGRLDLRRGESIGLSEFFIGVIVVAIVGNAAEHWVAVLVARKDKMDLAVNIAIGSSAQIALFVAPLLVLLSFVFGPVPMPLVFNGFEVAALCWR